MTNDPIARFERARELGALALLRLRAEVLLEDFPPNTFTPEERDRLERITAAPNEEDRAWLNGFDELLAEDSDPSSE